MHKPMDSAQAIAAKASRLLDLAREKFGTLSQAEQKLFEVAANGKVADYSADSEEDNDPAGAQKWGDERILKADRIAWLCTDSQASVLVSHRGIQVKGARIDGELDLQFAKIPFPLYFEKSAFPGQINLSQAEVRGLLLSGTHTGSIFADRVKVEGSVFLRNGFKAVGQVRLLGATIGGDLDCKNGQFTNAEGNALNADEAALSADGVRVQGGVFLRNGFKAVGQVRLLGVTIGTDLDCEKGQFTNGKGYALSADGVKVEGNVFLRNGFKAVGQVSLHGATVDGYFIWIGVTSPEEATLNLQSAKIGTLWDEPDSWPESGKLYLHGLVYDEIADDAPIDAKTRIEWLYRQPTDHFRPQPYEQLAAVLRKGGYEADAKKILIAKEEDRGRFMKLPFFHRGWHGFIGLTIGYGHHPWKALWWILLVVVLGWGLFAMGSRAGVMRPTKESAYVLGDGGENRRLSEEYPKFNPLVYSLDMFVPLVNLHQASYWLPNANREGELLTAKGLTVYIRGDLLRWYLWVHIILGWILTTLLVVGLSGLIRS